MFSKYSYELISNPTRTIDQEPGSFENSCLSENIHEQGESSLCWAFAIATMIRSALKYFLRQNKKNMTQDVIDKVNELLQRNDFHSYLRKQIIMNPIPKRIKKDESAEERRSHEVHRLRSAALQVRLNFLIHVPCS